MLALTNALLGFVVGVLLALAVRRVLALKGPVKGHAGPIRALCVGMAPLTAILFPTAQWRFDGGAELARALVLVCVVVSLATIDLARGLLPNAITAPAFVAGLMLSAVADPGCWWIYPASALAVGAGLLAVAVAYPGGMGMGDVKMGAMLGAFLGPYAAFAVSVGAVCGAGAGVFLIAAGILRRDAGLPFGPFLALGAVLALFFGPEVWSFYANLT